MPKLKSQDKNYTTTKEVKTVRSFRSKFKITKVKEIISNITDIGRGGTGNVTDGRINYTKGELKSHKKIMNLIYG